MEVLKGLRDELATPDSEGNALLERIVEVVGLPVLDVIGIFELAIDVDVDVVEEAEVEFLSDNVFVVLLQVHKTSMIGFFECPEEVSTDVICVVFRSSNRNLFAVVSDSVPPVVLLPGFPR